ncbi:hypothetical protein FB451DRAFT_1191508 [Mycena latifolia]|nr:hypothetical protein FB451DRAFT_1191508 [Mycena latifolia]
MPKSLQFHPSEGAALGDLWSWEFAPASRDKILLWAHGYVPNPGALSLISGTRYSESLATRIHATFHLAPLSLQTRKSISIRKGTRAKAPLNQLTQMSGPNFLVLAFLIPRPYTKHFSGRAALRRHLRLSDRCFLVPRNRAEYHRVGMKFAHVGTYFLRTTMYWLRPECISRKTTFVEKEKNIDLLIAGPTPGSNGIVWVDIGDVFHALHPL